MDSAAPFVSWEVAVDAVVHVMHNGPWITSSDGPIPADRDAARRALLRAVQEAEGVAEMGEQDQAAASTRSQQSARDMWVSRTLTAEAENKLLREALVLIASMPTTELNPDGVDQAAWSMQLVARDALAPDGEGQ
jgi:hypothetical protein